MPILLKELLFVEDFKTQAKKFESGGVSKDIVKHYIDAFKKIRDAKYKIARDGEVEGLKVPKGNARFDIDKYGDFHQLEIFVDYVSGQIEGLRNKGREFTDIKVDAKPLGEKNGLEIYYAKDKHACIHYKGDRPYSWCVARSDSSNMYNTYRFKEYEPTFYFVKDVEATKEEFSQPFEGQFNNPWHFFVIQSIGSGQQKYNDVDFDLFEETIPDRRYIVTSANNDGDTSMTWGEIVQIQPKLDGMEKYFQHVPLEPKERERYKKFMNSDISDEEFAKLSYEDKESFLDIAIPNKQLSPKMFLSLPPELKNKYIGFGVGIDDETYEYVKKDKALLKRFFQISLRKYQEYKKNGYPPVNPAEADVLYSAPNAKEIFKSADDAEIEHAIGRGVDLDVLANTYDYVKIRYILRYIPVAFFNAARSSEKRKKFFKYVDANSLVRDGLVPHLYELLNKDWMVETGVPDDILNDAIEFIGKFHGGKITIDDAIALVNLSGKRNKRTLNKAIELYKSGKVVPNEAKKFNFVRAILQDSPDVNAAVKELGINNVLPIINDPAFHDLLQNMIIHRRDGLITMMNLFGGDVIRKNLNHYDFVYLLIKRPIEEWNDIIELVGADNYKNLDGFSVNQFLTQISPRNIDFVVNLIGRKSIENIEPRDALALISTATATGPTAEVTVAKWLNIFGKTVLNKIDDYSLYKFIQGENKHGDGGELVELLFTYFADNAHGYEIPAFLYYHPNLDVVLKAVGPKIATLTDSSIIYTIFSLGFNLRVEVGQRRLERIMPFIGHKIDELVSGNIIGVINNVYAIEPGLLKMLAKYRTKYNAELVSRMLYLAVGVGSPEFLDEIGKSIGPENLKLLTEVQLQRLLKHNRNTKKMVYDFLCRYFGKDSIDDVVKRHDIDMTNLTEHLRYKNYFALRD